MTSESKNDILASLANIYVSMHSINLKEGTFAEIGSRYWVKDSIDDRCDPQEALYKTIDDLVCPSFRNSMREFVNLDTLSERLRNETVISHEFYGVRKTWARSSFLPVRRSEDGELLECIYAVQKIDEEKQRELEYQRQLEEALQNTNAIYREIIDMQMAGVIAIDENDYSILAINDAARTMLGAETDKNSEEQYENFLKKALVNFEEVIAKFRERTENDSDIDVYETYVKTKTGISRNILNQSKRLTLLHNNHVMINTLTDITAQKKFEKKLLRISESDGLTNIYNRVSGEKKIFDLLRHTKRSGMFCLFDIDHFKYFNDTFGHAFGDQVIQETANCMKHIFREDSDIVMRLGGDEFAAFVPNVSDTHNGIGVIKRLIRRIEAMQLEGLKRKVSISVGAVMISQGEDVGFDQMYKEADELMYRCKKISGSAYLIKKL